MSLSFSCPRVAYAPNMRNWTSHIPIQFLYKPYICTAHASAWVSHEVFHFYLTI